MSEKKTTTKDGRIRNITFMLYEDSCNPEWQKLLEEEHIPCMWIYHNKDVNPTGEPKKPHWHVMLCFEGKKSAEQLQYYVDLCGAANGVYQEVASIRAMARYLCHMDNPDKAQYDSSEVHAIAIDYNAIIGMASDKYKAISEMIDFCEENNIISFRELLIYSRIHKYDWFKSLCVNSSFVIKEYLKSKEWEQARELQNKVDPNTGEIL